MTAGAVAISLGGLIVRSLTIADVAVINFYRSIALIITTTLILFLWQRGNIISQIAAIGVKGIAAGAVLGAAGIMFLMALIHTTVANTVLITSSTPLISAALAYLFLGEKLARSTTVAVIVALVGVTVMVVDGLGTAFSFGNIMALGTAFGYAIFAVTLRSKRDSDMLPTILVAGLVVTVYSAVQSGGELQISYYDLLLCLIWGGILSASAHWFMVISSKQLTATELSLFMLLEVALAPLWVWMFVGETPGSAALIGGALVIAGLLISMKRNAAAEAKIATVKS